MARKDVNSSEDSQRPPSSSTGKGKGKPTPSRKDAEAARYRPLVPADRKLAKQIEKQKRDEALEREQSALQTGDERYLPVKDKGKVRRFVRDWIDARWSFSEFLLPAMLLFLAGMLAVSFIPLAPQVRETTVVGVAAFFYFLFAISIIEGIVVWRRIKQRIRKRYPDEQIPSGTWLYMFSRMLMARRWRSPKPQVTRGDFPAVPDYR